VDIDSPFGWVELTYENHVASVNNSSRARWVVASHTSSRAGDFLCKGVEVYSTMCVAFVPDLNLLSVACAFTNDA
jgi:hypothetical protein